MRTLYYVDASSDDSACGLFDENFELMYSFDSLHGSQIDEGLMNVLGFDVIHVMHDELITYEEYEDTVLSNQVPNVDLVIERLKERFGS